MNIPEFTAGASLYRTNGHYRSGAGATVSGPVLSPAYYPGRQETRDACDRCLTKSAAEYTLCLGTAAVASAGCLIFYGACFAAAALGCWTAFAIRLGGCATDDCCPKRCGAINPFEPGQGCCDKDEQCVDRYDPNSRQGCCPSDQIVCGGKCCAKGDSCCGDRCCPKGNFCCGETCCPDGYFCRDGWACDREFIGEFPKTPPPKPPKRPFNICKEGWAPCGTTCCPPGLQCCSVGGGQVACMTSCVR